jgi:hypothetical protein
MYLCYIDESGTSDLPGTSSHFVLAGLAIPIDKWRYCERIITDIKNKYDLTSVEIHTGWILRKYLEQNKIRDFEKLNIQQRIQEITRYRRSELYRLQKTNPKLYKTTKKNYIKTDPYIHLTYEQRLAFVEEIAKAISRWTFARLFAESIDKTHYDATKAAKTIDEQAFEQIVTRFEKCLSSKSYGGKKYFGLLIHDNNQTIAKKHTERMKHFHQVGTLWTEIDNIIETPLFVDSKLTSTVQLADLCAYAIRRYLENNEEFLFNHIIKRADRKGKVIVGVRHFSKLSCSCKICLGHRQS